MGLRRLLLEFFFPTLKRGANKLCAYGAVTIERISRSTPLEIPGNVDDDDAAVATEQKDYLEQIGAAVVEEVLPPVADDQLRHQNADFLKLGLALDFEDVIDDRGQNVAVGRLQNLEFWNGFAGGAQGNGYVTFPIAQISSGSSAICT